MRGIYNSVTDIRRNVFTEIARLAYEGGDYASSIEKLPFKIIPGERATYRDSIFLERAIVGERLRLGIGLPVRRMDEHSSLSDGIEESAIAEKYYDDPLVNVIKFACNACPEKTVVVTDTCQGCLAHPCKEVCPKDAISMVNGKSYIDQENASNADAVWMCVHMVQSISWSVLVQEAAVWMPLPPMSWVGRKSTMISVYPAVCVW